jgi:hypothetical protein
MYIKSIKQILLNPNLFFKEKSEEKVNLKVPFMLVFLNGILAVASSALVLGKVMEALPSDFSSYIIPGALIGVIVGLIGAFSGWLILAGVFHLISLLFDSQGSFKRTIEFVGYGYIPKIFATSVGLIVLAIVLQPIDISLQDPEVIQQTLDKMVSNNPLLWLYQIVGIICALWSANIWIFAITHARNLSIKKAFLSILIPVGFALVYSSYNLITSLA